MNRLGIAVLSIALACSAITSAAQAAQPDDFFRSLSIGVQDNLTAEPVFLAASKGDEQRSKGSMSGSRAQSDLLLCDWFDIYCNNGATDACCGSVNSCLGYCAEVCGGPCIYVN